LGVSSYSGGTETTGEVRITSDVTKPMAGKHLLVVEDIIDTGLTMKFLLENLAARRPASLKVATLLEKPSRAKVKVPIDYRGFVIEDRFVVGYGLDWAERYRNLPFIGVVEAK
ncbi:MAG: phosphoribosyltransferase family protein, partial [Byssovorax sp.]